MAILMDGKALAEQRRAELKNAVEAYKSTAQRTPCLNVVLVGEDSASELYVKNKIKMAEVVGIQSKVERLHAECAQEDVLQRVDALNEDPCVDGILVQLPLPKAINADKVIAQIAADKDVDGLTPVSLGNLIRGIDGVRPCTPRGILTLLDHYEIALEGKEVVIVGRSSLVGKPMALMLLERDATVKVCHSRTQDLAEVVGEADLLICAIGQPEFIRPEWLKKGVSVVDVGITKTPKGWVGDVCAEGIREKVSAWTPVPGGVGPMTVISLLENTLELAAHKK
ncbi:MAG: bifunctional 5,10-methylenetetrahydrofolate dehydrogenase/5,10-methenyltetrahydrofolate cyclohydrolase [Myxococcota bacterium]|jgi:methylenetetrahydrofolate dehydrogenase (NADP+)/methenyltetrahydrofolate cyclohydrolase|nr:bifunctional 5,10-methylenetetrahydrofolate dehydrogenase/5,10-methenyltetrahydrofolate cyclohydrolase [Myxococcota bacterium]